MSPAEGPVVAAHPRFRAERRGATTGKYIPYYSVRKVIILLLLIPDSYLIDHCIQLYNTM